MPHTILLLLLNLVIWGWVVWQSRPVRTWWTSHQTRRTTALALTSARHRTEESSAHPPNTDD